MIKFLPIQYIKQFLLIYNILMNKQISFNKYQIYKYLKKIFFLRGFSLTLEK